MKGLRTGLRLGTIALIVIGAFATGGCGGDASTTSNTGTPQAGGTLNVAQAEEVVTLDPTAALDNASNRVISQIMEPLFKTSPDGKIEPWLVDDFSHSADGLEWTFHLKHGISFSNGEPLTAGDVVYSLDRARASATRGPLYEAISDVRAASPSTVVIVTEKPFAPMTAVLSLFAAGIVPKNLGGMSEKQFAQHPIGSGPFTLGSWKQGQSLTLERNPSYWQPHRPLLDKVVFHAVPDDSSRVAQLRGGQLDLIESPPWAQLASLETAPGIEAHEYALSQTDSLVLNTREPLFQDKRVREAASLALDREGIVATALNGHGQPAGSWLAPSLLYSDQQIKPVQEDKAKAKRLLAEAVSEGAEPRFTLIYTSGLTYAPIASQIMQQDLEAVGFSVKLQPLDSSAVIAQASAGKFGGFLIPYTSDIVDPSQAISTYIATEGIFAGIDTEDLSSLSNEAMEELDPKQREAKYVAIQEELAREMNILPLDYQPYVWGMKSNVAGFNLNATGIPSYADVGFTE